MFDWFKKTPTPKEIEAYQLGQRVVMSMSADLDSFIEARFTPARHYMLDTLRAEFDEAIHVSNMPPVIAFRISFDAYLENFGKIKEYMTPEIHGAMSKWFEVADQNGLRDEFARLIDLRIEQFEKNLNAAVLTLVAEKADELKEADDLWRKANPEMSAEFPHTQ